MNTINVDLVIDANGLSCPMPIVKLKKGMNELQSGQIVLLKSTDKGSKADINAWATSTGNEYLGTIEHEKEYHHYLRKASSHDSEKKHPITATNEELIKKLENLDNIQILDVREEAEYVFEHIPNSISIPFGQLADSSHLLKKDADIYVICRTGQRSDLAAQELTRMGFSNVINVIPGFIKWDGPTQKL